MVEETVPGGERLRRLEEAGRIPEISMDNQAKNILAELSLESENRASTALVDPPS